MTQHTQTFDRRSFVRGVAAAGTLAVAGCTSNGSDDDGGGGDPSATAAETTTTATTAGPDTVDLPPPKNYERLRNADVSYPIYGDELPDATVREPLLDEPMSTRAFVGERLTLVTFIYTRCGSICPALTANLVQVQADAAERGYSDRVALLPMTFDPAYDTPDRLREFGRQRGANVAAENWHFLEPQSEQRVQQVVVDTFGHPFQENPQEDGMPFIHNPMLVLANERGYVERTYANTVPDASTVVEDVRTLVEG
jgi:protein SCO1/2